MIADIPDNAVGPAIPEKGYLVEEVSDGLYWVTEGVYQMMFLTTGRGVIAVDAPPTIGRNILRAIGEVTDEPITHVVYTHSHADHIGAASLYPEDAVRVAHDETARLLAFVNDPNRPSPTQTFSDSHVLEVGSQALQLDHKGPNHSPDNVFVWSPNQRVLMLVDVIVPGWATFRNLNVSQYIPGWIGAHDQALSYPFETLVSGHLTRLGNRKDIETQREYIDDLMTHSRAALEGAELGVIVRELGLENPWAVFDRYLDAVIEQVNRETLPKWRDRLGGVEVFASENAFTMAESLRLDYGVLGPFGTRE